MMIISLPSETAIGMEYNFYALLVEFRTTEFTMQVQPHVIVVANVHRSYLRLETVSSHKNTSAHEILLRVSTFLPSFRVFFL